jgi:rod shape-determining protein MreD
VKGGLLPAAGALRRIDAWARAAFPAASAAVLLVFAAVPLGVPGLVPAVALPPVFFWSVTRPAALPPPVVFALGLLQDLLTAAPFGSGVLVLLAVHGLAAGWRGVLGRQSVLRTWLAYCGFAVGAGGLGWALEALLGWRLPPPGQVPYGAALTAGLYPSLAWLLARAHAAMRRAGAAA